MHVTPRMAILTIVGALAYLGLAVVGEGGLGPSSPIHPSPRSSSFLWRSPRRRCSPAAI